jgi:hypothetical protein
MRKEEGKHKEFETGYVFLDLMAACLRIFLEDFHRGNLLLGILGSRARRP